MAKFSDDTVMDRALSALVENVITMTVCSGQPTNYVQAITQKGTSAGRMLAKVDISAAGLTGPANGDTSGRKLTINQHVGIPVSATGGGNHVSLLSSTAAAKLWYVTTATSQTLTSGNTLTINAWDVEIADPS